MPRLNGIIKAAVSIALDNGSINRSRSKLSFEMDLDAYLLQHYAGQDELLNRCDAYLSSLTDTDLENLCCGDQDEEPAASAPKEVKTLLGRIFNEVL